MKRTLPLILILPLIWGLDGLWASLPTSDGLAALIAAVVMAVYLRKFKTYGAEETNY